MKTKFIIKDWADNHLFRDQEFETFEDGWEFLYQKFPNGDEDRTFDDLFVVERSV
jgi:hypothetical protein